MNTNDELLITHHEIPEEKSRKLKHIKIYNLLFQQISKGIFPPGSQLPSEPELSRQMGVSRMTLRQALALLREDGLIKNVQGKGNFVLGESIEEGSHTSGIFHPVFQCNSQISHTECEYRLEPPSEYMIKALKRNTPVTAIIDRWYHLSKTQVFAYSLSFVPVDIISRFNMNFQNPDDLAHFLNEDIYSYASSSLLNLKGSDTGNFTAQKYCLSEKNIFLMIQETLFDEKGISLMFSKYYIPLEFCNLTLSFQK